MIVDLYDVPCHNKPMMEVNTWSVISFSKKKVCKPQRNTGSVLYEWYLCPVFIVGKFADSLQIYFVSFAHQITFVFSRDVSVKPRALHSKDEEVTSTMDASMCHVVFCIVDISLWRRTIKESKHTHQTVSCMRTNPFQKCSQAYAHDWCEEIALELFWALFRPSATKSRGLV